LNNFQTIVKWYRQKEGFQVMVTIISFSNDVQSKINLAVGENNHEMDL